MPKSPMYSLSPENAKLYPTSIQSTDTRQQIAKHCPEIESMFLRRTIPP